MKGYRIFLFTSVALLGVYVLAEINRPRPLNWTMTLSADDRNPYGGYILFHSLQWIFPEAGISSYAQSDADELGDLHDSNTACLIFQPELELSYADLNALENYAAMGNYVFMVARDYRSWVLDSLQLEKTRESDPGIMDSEKVNFTNPWLREKKAFTYPASILDNYFLLKDSAAVTVLGTSDSGKVNFVRISIGGGAIYVSSAPICFTNIFMLKDNNAEYASRALSYLPREISKVHWKGFPVFGREASNSPLRYLLHEPSIKWAFWIGLGTMLFYGVFEAKRRQRMIPVIIPLQNTTLDFVRTVGNLYFNQHDNKNVAEKKINFLFEYIRSVFFIPNQALDDRFTDSLAAKSGVGKEDIGQLFKQIGQVQSAHAITDAELIALNQSIDLFYLNAKK
jgi:hypothetical protein